MPLRVVHRLPLFVVSVGICANLTGCATLDNTLQVQSRVNPVTPAVYSERACGRTRVVSSDTRNDAIDLDCFTFPENAPLAKSIEPPPRDILAYTLATQTPEARNRLTSIIIKHSDDICTMELGRLTANEATANTALSIVGTGLSTAATVVGGELAKSILSGGAALASASRDHINVHVYRNTIAQAISQVITAERKIERDKIQEQYKTDLKLWSIDDAIREVNVYHQQCSFYKGLELLLKAANNSNSIENYKQAVAQQRKMEETNANIALLEAKLKNFTEGSEEKTRVQQQYMQLLLQRTKDSDMPAKEDTATDEP